MVGDVTDDDVNVVRRRHGQGFECVRRADPAPSQSARHCRELTFARAAVSVVRVVFVDVVVVDALSQTCRGGGRGPVEQHGASFAAAVRIDLVLRW